MKRRFAVTLLAVAIAVIGAPAFAKAPVIGVIRSVIIADDVPATTANVFVYPDAFSLNPLATDPEGAKTSQTIIWSFYSASSRYLLNGRTSLVLPSDDPNNPGAKEVGGAGYDDPITSTTCGGVAGIVGRADDGDVRTVTFRDATLSPIGGPNTDPTPGVSTSSTVASAVVTLFASDGTSYSSANFMVYTESNGTDRLSGAAMEQVLAPTVPSATGTMAWSSATVFGSATITATGGLCIGVAGNVASPGNFAQWVSPFDIIDLVQNNVYRIRMQFDANGQTLAVNAAPLWDVVIDNYDPNYTGTGGVNLSYNKFLGYFTNWDTANSGANTPGQLAASGGRGTFDIWWCPPAVEFASWNDPTTGMFTSAKDAHNDIRLQFRILDVQSGSFDGSGDAGTICLKSITVDRIPISQLAVASTPYDSTISNSTHIVGTIFGTAAAGNNAGRTVVTYAGGAVTIAPNTTASNFASTGITGVGNTGPDAWDLEVINLDMGNSDNSSTPAEVLDNYPVLWVSDQLLKGSVSIEAPDAAGQATPPDAIMIQWDSPTNEILGGSGTVSTDNTSGMPVQGTVQDLVGFFYTQNKTAATNTNWDRIRMRVQLLCHFSINSGDNANNLGGVKISNERVDVVTVPN